MAAAFSRMQLAAALLEYDNDLDNPNAPFRSANDSALFAHIRRAGGPRPQGIMEYDDLPIPQTSNYLSMPLPNGRPASGMPSSNSRRSERVADVSDEEAQSDEVEVDLTSWGLDSFIPQKDVEKPKKRSGPARTGTMSEGPTSPLLEPPRSPRSPMSSTSGGEAATRSRRQSRALSVTNELAGPVGEPLDRNRRSSTLPLEAGRPMSELRAPTERRLSVGDMSKSIPFPSSSSTTPEARADPPNPFAIPPPPPNRASRFDPKARPPSISTTSRLDSASHVRAMSVGSRQLLDADHLSVSPGTPAEPERRRLSRIELMRPKVLVMPSPLQSNEPERPEEPPREGFQVASDGRPLPPGFRESVALARPGMRPLSGVRSASTAALSGDAYIPNPRLSMSLSQLTFRNQLVAGGSRDVAYADLDRAMPRAERDGEKIDRPLNEEEEALQRELDSRPVGRLYGKSLMDSLEERKAQLKGKQRVFTGDNRPSMMQRGQIRRSSTLIDPASLKTYPGTPEAPDPRYSTLSPNKTDKRISSAPLVNFGDDDTGEAAGIPRTRSVFGVDQIWERELGKLKAIEAMEKEEEEERAKEEELASTKKKGKRKGKRKGKSAETETSPIPEDRPSSPPPTLPQVPSVRSRPVDRGQSSGDSDDEPLSHTRRESTMTLGVRGWFAGSSDEEDGPKVSRSGSKAKQSRLQVAAAPRLDPISGMASDDDDDEDVPIAAQLRSGKFRSLRSRSADSEEEEIPIAALLDKSRIKLPSPMRGSMFGGLDIPSQHLSTPRLVDDEDEGDDVPLGLKHPQGARAAGGDEDDDKPLGLKYQPPPSTSEQQYQMMMQQQMAFQQQQMQQQIMMQTQAQIQNSMFAGSPMIGPLFPSFTGGPPPGMPMLTAPSVPEPSKLRVDKWRHDVVQSLP